VPERIIFKIAVQTKALHNGDAPQYLRQFTPIADIPSRLDKDCGLLIFIRWSTRSCCQTA